MTDSSPLIGWREFLALPDLGIHRIKAKIDTGARSSALHAFDLDPFQCGDQTLIRFKIHPNQDDSTETVNAEAPLLEYREVRNSGGQAETRPVISTAVRLSDFCWTLELTLTNRETMGFRMLLGREAIRNRFLVDPGGSYLLNPEQV